MPVAEVVVDSVAMADAQIYIYATGITVPSSAVEIRARVSGYLEELFFEPGAIVREGDRLALIEQAPYAIALQVAQAELAGSKAQAALAEANLERQKNLFARNTGTLEDVQTQQANYDIALARIAMAEANIRNAELNLQYTDMRAPITGKTTKNLVDVGNFVGPSGTGVQAVILSITQLDPMFVEFTLSDRQFIDLKDRIGFRDAFHEALDEAVEHSGAGTRPVALTGMPVDISLMTGINVFSFDFNIPGKIVAVVDNRINFSTAQITLRAEIQNPLLQTDGVEDYMVYPGQVSRVRIPYETVRNAILVREEAILTDLDTRYVLVVVRDEAFQAKDTDGNPVKGADGEVIPPRVAYFVHRRDIVLGRLLDTQQRIVLSGLQPGETYIVHGVQRVRIGAEVNPTTLEEHNARRAAELEESRE